MNNKILLAIMVLSIGSIAFGQAITQIPKATTGNTIDYSLTNYLLSTYNATPVNNYATGTINAKPMNAIAANTIQKLVSIATTNVTTLKLNLSYGRAYYMTNNGVTQVNIPAGRYYYLFEGLNGAKILNVSIKQSTPSVAITMNNHTFQGSNVINVMARLTLLGQTSYPINAIISSTPPASKATYSLTVTDLKNSTVLASFTRQNSINVQLNGCSHALDPIAINLKSSGDPNYQNVNSTLVVYPLSIGPTALGFPISLLTKIGGVSYFSC